MARPLRLKYEGAVYHLTGRGNERSAIFRDDEDRRRFLGILGSVVNGSRWLLHGYCLMGNHYHLLLETPLGNLSRGTQRLNGRYTQSFDFRHRRSAHLLQGRYKAFLVDRDEYLASLVRYVHENQVRARVVRRTGDYRWSSHRSYLKGGPRWLSCDEALQRLGTSRSAVRRYVQTPAGEEGFARSAPERPGNESPTRSKAAGPARATL